MKKTRIMFISFEEEWKIESEEYILERLVLKLFGVRSEISCSVSKFQTYKNFLINAYRVSTDNSLSRPTHRETFPTGARGMFVCHWHFARSHETFAPRQKLRRLNEELRHVPIEPLLTAASSLSSSLFFAQRLPRWHVLTWWVWTAARVFLPTS